MRLVLNTKATVRLNRERLEKKEYNWLDLGRVGYGLRNDEGSVHVHMSIGYLKKKNLPNYPDAVVDVIEKYYGSSNGFDHGEPHKIESVIYNKPTDLVDLIEKFSGEDKRKEYDPDEY